MSYLCDYGSGVLCVVEVPPMQTSCGGKREVAHRYLLLQTIQIFLSFNLHQQS